MMNMTIEELLSENQQLRDLAISLSITLQRNLALDPPEQRRNISSVDAEHLVEVAEKCFRCAENPRPEKRNC